MNLLTNRRVLSGTGLAVAVALLLSINILSGATLKSMRFDLTENGLYTLSPAAVRVLESMKEPVTLRFYFSEKIAGDFPQVLSYAQRIEELLHELQNHSGGKLTVEIHDPEPFSEIEERAVQFGLKGVPVNAAGESLYFGLAGTNSTDQRDVIPFFQEEKEPFLEYDLTKLVYALSNPKKPVVGLLSTLPIEGATEMARLMRQEMPDPWFVMDQIRQLYEVRTVQPNASEIPSDVNLLVIVHPKNLGQDTLYAIDQFVLNGGHAAVFVDPFCQADQPPQDPNNPMAGMTFPRASDLGSLFQAWGVRMEEGKIAGDLRNAIEMPFDNRGRRDIAPHVQYLDLGPDSLDQDSPVTAQFEVIRVGTAGILSKRDGATTEFRPVIQTSTESMAINVSSIQFMADPKTLLNDFVPGKSRLTLAAFVTGPVKSAFPDGKPKAAEPAEGEEAPPEPAPGGAHLVESKEPINVLVVSDVDLLTDQFWVRVQDFGGMRIGIPNAKNGDLVINALDFLQGSTDLVELRARGGSKRPFERVEELRRKAQQDFRAEEQRLTGELDQVVRELNELLSKKGDMGSAILPPDVLAKIDEGNQKKLELNQKLRDVRHELNKDVESLGTKLKLINIGLIPALIAVLAVSLSTYKSNRRKSP